MTRRIIIALLLLAAVETSIKATPAGPRSLFVYRPPPMYTGSPGHLPPERRTWRRYVRVTSPAVAPTVSRATAAWRPQVTIDDVARAFARVGDPRLGERPTLNAGQRTNRRLGRRAPFVPVVTHGISIDTPTAQTAFTASTTPLTLSGTAFGPSADHIDWTNDRGGSGTASGVLAWSITASAGASTIFSDALGCPTTTALTSRVPQVGTGYTEAVDTAGTVTLNCTTGGYAAPDSSPAAGSVVIYTLTPSPALSGTAFDFRVTAAGNPSSNKRWGMVYRYSDASNYCAVVVRSGVYSPDLYWVKKVAGVFSDIQAATNGDQSSGTVIRLVRTGSSVELFAGGVSKGTSSDSFCDDNTTLAVGTGALGGDATNTMGSDVRFDDVTIIDPGGGGSGVTLQSGTNVLDVLLKSAAGATLATDRLTVAYNATDSQAPVASIHTPTAGPTDATATSAYPVTATLTDNTGVTDGTFTCTPASGTCTPASGTLDGTFNGSLSVEASKTFTLSCGPAPGVANTIVFTPHDAAMNSGVSDTLITTCTSSDVTAPVPIISTNGGADFTTTASSYLLDGTASDIGSGLDRIEIECSGCSPALVVAGGTSTWAGTVNLGSGANVITVRAYDLAGNNSTDTITITRTVALSILTSSPLSSVTEDVAMTPQEVQGLGGTPPYVWSISGTPTTPNDGDAQCAGLAHTNTMDSPARWRLSGTPTTTGACDWTLRLTDNSGGPCPGSACVDKAFQINVVAEGTGPNDYYQSLILDSNWYAGTSFEPNALVNCTDAFMGKSFASGTRALTTCNPYFKDSLLQTGSNNYIPQTKIQAGDMVTRDTTVGGVRFDIPPYTTPNAANGGPGALLLDLPSGAATGLQQCEAGAPSNCIIIRKSGVSTNSVFANERGVRVDNELFKCDFATGFDPAVPTAGRCRRTILPAGGANGIGQEEIRVLRGMYGTTAAAHTAGATNYVMTHTAGSSQTAEMPITTTDGYTWVYTYDFRLDSNWIGSGVGNTGMKFLNIRSEGSIWSELKIIYPATSPLPAGSPCTNNGVAFNAGTMVGSINGRTYNQLAAAPNVAWSDTSPLGNVAGDNITYQNPLTPQAASFCLVPNRWTRIWEVVTQRANDYELLDVWIADEVAAAVKIFSGLEISVRQPGNRMTSKYFEMNDDVREHSFGTVNPFRTRSVWWRNFALMREADTSRVTTPGAGLLVQPKAAN